MAGPKALWVAGFVLVALFNTALASSDPFSFWTEKKEDSPEPANQFLYAKFETEKEDKKNPSEDVAMIQGFVEVVDIMKKGYQVGTASVKSNAPPPCPSGDRGKSRTGRSNGCTHDHCTEAKNQARENLRNVVHPACYPHISSTSPCRKVNC